MTHLYDSQTLSAPVFPHCCGELYVGHDVLAVGMPEPLLHP